MLDVTSEPDWLRVIAEIGGSHDRLDGLVNAAGLAVLGTIEETDFATWRQVMAVNLDGTFLGCKHALPLLKRRGGAIVNISSVSGMVGGHNFAAYNASKGGVRLLSKSVALHGARLDPKVRCNSIHPAFLEGPMVEPSSRRPSFRTARAPGSRAISRSAAWHGRRGRRSLRLSAVGGVRFRYRRRIRDRRRADRALIGNRFTADGQASGRRGASSPAAP